MKPEDLKLIVQEKYGEIALQRKSDNKNSCCGGTSCCDEVNYTVFSDDYTPLEGYNAEADLGLGCGLPTQHAGIKKNDHVLDLGSGAGNDCFVARKWVGEEGKITGVDFTMAMVEKARKNLEKTDFKNIEFIQGDIEDMPFSDNTYDVVISNCVLNLVPDKIKAFREISRVLKPGGHFCISDVVLAGILPAKLQEAAEMYAGCVSGALHKNEYLDIIRSQGFQHIEIKEEKKIEIPDNILLQYISNDELRKFKVSEVAIYSITVNASKVFTG